jgi:putative ABC transport system ATP-binding protein
MSDSQKPAAIEMLGVSVAALRDPTLTLLHDVNWTVQPGEFWVVAGPPRSGKSDLLLHAAGLLAPAAGVCRLFGRDTAELDESQLAVRLRVGLTFADGKLFNQLSLAENVALPLRYHRNPSESETARTVETLLDLLELTPYASLLPGSVATVWRQRAALARALVLQPELLLLDNPGGSLMTRHRGWLMHLLDQLWHGHAFYGGRPLTLVVTTDDLPVWQHPGRKFAAAHEGNFTVLGAWGGEPFRQHEAVKELLAGATEQEVPRDPAPPPTPAGREEN